MHLDLTEDQRALVSAMARLLDVESSMERVRAALPGGFDPRLWQSLGEHGALSLRAPEEAGGVGLGILDAVLLMEEAGRTLASGPVAETLVAARLLALLDPADATGLREPVASGAAVITLAMQDVAVAPRQLVAGGAVAQAVIARNGERVQLFRPSGPARPSEVFLQAAPLATLDLSTIAATDLGVGVEALALHAAAIEEWKLLMAGGLIGVAAEAVRMASAYAVERVQFGRPIGGFQAVSHPLAQAAVEVDAGRLMIWRAIRAVADGAAEAGAEISGALWWASRTADAAVLQALHTFGGYGVTLEYDIHLYNVRAKTWPLVWGDPERLLEEAGRRRYLGERTHLPAAGSLSIDFELGDGAKALADETRAFFQTHLTPEKRARSHFSWEGHDPEIHKRIAEAGLLFPGWPEHMGGRGASVYAVEAARDVWDEENWTTFPQMTAEMIGRVMDRFGSERLKSEVLAKVRDGDATVALGFSEPGSGSDVFAAQTSAARDGDDWRINGQKMFTTGGDKADYAILLARTDPASSKHAGLTVFMVPLKAPAVTVQPVHTFQDEQTNITFYSDVLVPDAYRLGEVGGGAHVMAASLEMEQGNSFVAHHRRLLRAAERLVKSEDRLEHPRSLVALARSAARVAAAEALNFRVLWTLAEGRPIGAFGSASKMFSSEVYRADASDLLNLAAPLALTAKTADAAYINHCYRHSQITVTYGGTSEVHRSLIAEKQLGLPRSR